MVRPPQEEPFWDMKSKGKKNLQEDKRILCDESYQRRGMEVILPLPLIVMWIQEGGGTSNHKVLPRERGHHTLLIQGGNR